MRIGIDLGGTRVKGGLVDAEGRLLASRIEEVGGDTAEEAVVARLAALVAALRADADGPVAGVGVAAAGVLDRAAGLIRESPNFPAWRDLALGRRVAAACGLPVALENDANAVILGEALAGAGRGVADLVGLTLGTGVGGGIVLGGRLWRGARGMAGELGHLTVVPDGRPCGCGSRGCLEQYAGAVGIRRSLREAGGELAALAASPDAPRLLAARADAGDAAARGLYADVGDKLGMVVAACVHALDVTRVLLCGGLAAAEAHFMPALLASFRARTFRSMAEGVEVRCGSLGADAGVIGAALASP